MVSVYAAGIKWYQFVQTDDIWRLTKQPKLTAIIQSHRLTLFGHIMCMDDNADAKRILLASPPADWRRQPGRSRITWLSTVQQDLKQHHLTLPEAADLAQNRPMWRMMSMYDATQSYSCMPETTTTTACSLVIALQRTLTVTITSQVIENLTFKSIKFSQSVTLCAYMHFFSNMLAQAMTAVVII